MVNTLYMRTVFIKYESNLSQIEFFKYKSESELQSALDNWSERHFF